MAELLADTRLRVQTHVASLLKGEQRKNFALTFATELLILISGVLTLQLAGNLLGSAGFGEYAVSKRAMNVVAYPLLFGLGISIPRYVALAETPGLGANTRQRAYFFGGFGMVVPIVLVFSSIALLQPSFFAQIFFGSSEFSYLMVAVVLLTVGICLHTILYGYFRGRMQMGRANLFEFLNLGLVPPLAVLCAHRDAASVLSLTGMIWITTSMLVWASLVVNIGFAGLSIGLLRDSMREMFWYGLPRVPGEFALFGLFAIPTFIVASRQGIEIAGFFSFGVSVLQMISGLFKAVGILLLPYVSRLASQARWGQVSLVVTRALMGCLALALIIVVISQMVLSVVVPLFMGPAFSQVMPYSGWLLFGTLPFVIYVVLRNPLDAITEWPHNSINLLIVLVVTVALLWFQPLHLSAPAGMVASLHLLGLLSVWSWRRSLKQAISQASNLEGAGMPGPALEV